MTEAFWNRDDYDDFFSLHSDMERFFGNMPYWRRPSAVFEKAWKPLCDVYECADNFTVVVELAWVDEEKVEVTLHGRVLSIRGHRERFHPSDISNTYMLEINYGDFERVLELPTDIDAEATRAIYRKGLLEIILPKLKREKLRGVDISSE
ncbi:MAG: Hsp20/alpha crystallin family protein [Actinomycetota bacterium]